MSQVYECGGLYNEHGWEAHEPCIKARGEALGVDMCYVCGNTLVECNQRAKEMDFDECEWLAGT